MKKYDVAKIMKNAWIGARDAELLHGGKKSEYFRECLKEEWAFAKQMQAAVEAPRKKAAVRIEKSVNEIIEIKDWFVRKNFSNEESYVIATNDWIEVLAETAKAYKLRVHNAECGNLTTWAPKKCCVA
ncbi:hypothetical protein [Sporolactobacillus terrae]|uniref:hypothetical protein n=1 Tax=Sporolactobacillus terrae TaxID=269673 RepID=UPI00048F3ED4|nr:hypothetical protein [Sporolactobacillus terrae]